MKKIIWTSVLLLVISFSAYLFTRPGVVHSLPSTNLSDTLSSSELSYFARIGTGTTAGDSIIKIGATGAPSKTTSNLFPGDIVGIARNDGLGVTNVAVKDIGNTGSFELVIPLPVTNSNVGNYVIATHSSIHTISFTPQSSIAGGVWQFLIKATSVAAENRQDGLPDQQGFDLGNDIVGTGGTGVGTRLKAADVFCPWGATASVGATAIVNAVTYHAINCSLGVGVSNPVGVATTMTIGRALTVGSQLINPSPSTNHTEGLADANGPDVYTFMMRHLDASSNVIDFDTASGKIAVLEAVRVTATVDPTITFQVDSTNVTTPGQYRCGVPLSAAAANTTATSVSFGSLSIGSANDLAQRISCLTNGSSYVVTAYESDQLRSIQDATSTIPDTTCDGNCAGIGTSAVWGLTTASKFGYSLEAISTGMTLAIGSTSSSYYAKPFGTGTANLTTIMSRYATPATADQTYVCYRVTASTAQKAGSYETDVIYTATATF
ncbi:MAG TPA: hypothetical protein VF828_01525 [Patescibacteria group bacterium]